MVVTPFLQKLRALCPEFALGGTTTTTNNNTAAELTAQLATLPCRHRAAAAGDP